MSEEDIKEDKPTDVIDDDLVAKTVFYHAIKEGVEEDEALRLATKIGEIRYNAWHQRLKRWLLGRLQLIGVVITSVITGILTLAGEQILEYIKTLLQ